MAKKEVLQPFLFIKYGLSTVFFFYLFVCFLTLGSILTGTKEASSYYLSANGFVDTILGTMGFLKMLSTIIGLLFIIPLAMFITLFRATKQTVGERFVLIISNTIFAILFFYLTVLPFRYYIY